MANKHKILDAKKGPWLANKSFPQQKTQSEMWET